MAHDTKSAGNGSATGSALHANPATPRDSGAQQAHSSERAFAALFSEIGADASVLTELLQTLIGSGSEEGNQLACAVALLARIGMCADIGARACGATAWRKDPVAWLLSEGAMKAMGQLQPASAAVPWPKRQAQAKRVARAVVAAAKVPA